MPETFRERDADAKWLSRFLHKWSWSWQSSNTKGAYLPDECEEMAEMRRSHEAQRIVEKAPWELCLNYDQMWRCAYEPPSKVLHKRRGKKQDKTEEFRFQ